MHVMSFKKSTIRDVGRFYEVVNNDNISLGKFPKLIQAARCAERYDSGSLPNQKVKARRHRN